MDEFKRKLSDYGYYLADIQKRFYGLALVFIIFFVVGFFCSSRILKFIIGIFDLEQATIITTSPFQFLDLAMSIGLYTGLIICLPLFIYHLYAFLKDGLSPKERKIFLIILPISLILFLIGFAYSFFVLYSILDSIAAINATLGVQNLWDINKFLSQIIATSSLLGLVFQFPIVLSFLIKIGLIDLNFLKSKRRHAILVMFIGTSLLPPTDGVSLVVMVLPLILIYEINLLVNTILNHKANRADVYSQV